MSRQKSAASTLIPVNRINIPNPRVRNAKVFEEIVHNIRQVGLKRPITVTPCYSGAKEKDYDLVCGQGRLEAFIACRQKAIPAIVVNTSEELALIESLVENIARRRHTPMELLEGVEMLRKRGYDAKAIAAKIGHKTEYVKGIIKLLDNGEERLVSAVEAGHIPLTLAIDVAMSPHDEQRAIQEAYDNKQLSGNKLMAVRRLLESRRRRGKAMLKNNRHARPRREDVSANEILKAYKQEVNRKRMLARKADVVNTRLLFLVEAMRRLMQEDHFTTLLRAEGLETMPKQLAALLTAKGG